MTLSTATTSRTLLTPINTQITARSHTPAKDLSNKQPADPIPQASGRKHSPEERRRRLIEFDSTYNPKYARYLPKPLPSDPGLSIHRIRLLLTEQYGEETIDRVPPRFILGSSYLIEEYMTTFLRAVREGKYMPKRYSQGYCVLRAIMEEHKRVKIERRDLVNLKRQEEEEAKKKRRS